MKWRYLANILFFVYFYTDCLYKQKKEVKVTKVYGEHKIGTSL